MKLYTELMHADCIQLLKKIKDEKVDAIVTDPPYCYLNTQGNDYNCDFDKNFDNLAFVEQCKRILKDTGFVVMFGRGENFYRLNTLFCDAGFKFKEDIIWNKASTSSPFHQVGRIHENIVIFAKNKGIIRKTKVPYLEDIKTKDIKSKKDIKELLFELSKNITTLYNKLNKPEELQALKEFLAGNVIYSEYIKKSSFDVARKTPFYRPIGAISTLKMLTKGRKETDIINIPTIIKEPKSINTYHPTEKPIRLMERLINLVTDENDIVLDPFMGSGTTGVASISQKRHFVGIELDEKYYDIAVRRIEDEKKKSVMSIFDILDDETIEELQSAMQEEENKKDDEKKEKDASLQFNFPNGRMSQDEINEALKDAERCEKIIKEQREENSNKTMEEQIEELNKEYDKITI